MLRLRAPQLPGSVAPASRPDRRRPLEDPLLLRLPAFFSLLGPGKHLPEHRGPYNGVLRHHLGLIVPEPARACAIRVAGQTAHWREGECLIFDDSYPQEAWNDTDRDRLVLFLDIVRPLPRPVSWLNAAVIKAIGRSPFVRGSKARYFEWEQRFEARWAALTAREADRRGTQ